MEHLAGKSFCRGPSKNEVWNYFNVIRWDNFCDIHAQNFEIGGDTLWQKERY